MEAAGRVKKDNIVSQLASARGHNDQSANVELAQALCKDQDHAGIACLVDVLQTGAKSQRTDAIKVLYEVGACDPKLIVPHVDVFFDTLKSRENRMVWGSLMTLAKICKAQPDAVAQRLDLVLAVADAGSVIAKDQAIEILATLKSVQDHAGVASRELFDRLRGAAINQLPKYAEITLASLLPGEREEFIDILGMRLGELMPEAKRRRLRKVKDKAESANR